MCGQQLCTPDPPLAFSLTMLLLDLAGTQLMPAQREPQLLPLGTQQKGASGQLGAIQRLVPEQLPLLAGACVLGEG